MSGPTESINKTCDTLLSQIREAFDVIRSPAATAGHEQLRSVTDAISSLESKGVPVPEALAALRSELQTGVDSYTKAVEALSAARVRIDEISTLLSTEAQELKLLEDTPSVAHGHALQDDEMESYLVQALRNLDGGGAVEDVLTELGSLLHGVLTPADIEKDRKGHPKWHSTAQWAHQNLIEKGVIELGSARGGWHLAPQYLKESA